MIERVTRFRHWGLVLDAVLLILLASVAAKVGMMYQARITRTFTPAFYQGEFGPAVLEACGRGFGNPLEPIPALAAFLTQQRTTFDCHDLPQGMHIAPRDSFQQASRYMMFVVAMYWRATGVSWTRLTPIFGGIQALFVGLGYLAFRVVLARMLAAPLSLALAYSSAQLSILPYLRDSTKGPFFMAIALVVVLVWTRPLSRRTIVILCAVFGLITGIGLGFRPDVVIWFPALGLAVLCAQHDTLVRRLANTALGSLVAVATFVVVGWPILTMYTSGSNFGHVAILGYTKPFDDSLGVRGGPYSRGYFYSDAYVNVAVDSYAKRVYGHRGKLNLMSEDYERYATRYFWDMTRTFPADFATRLGITIVRVLNLPFERGSSESDYAIQDLPSLRAVFEIRNKVLGALDGWGPYFILAVFALLAARRFALAVGFAATVLYLAGLPVLQFHLRHFSHLEWLGLFALGVIVQWAAVSTVAAMRRETRAGWGWRPFGRAATRVGVCVGAVVVIPIVSVALLRARQQTTLSRLFDAYDAEATDVLTYSTQPEDSGRVLVLPKDVPAHNDGRNGILGFMRDDYLVIDLSDDCDSMTLTLRIKYDPKDPWVNFSRDIPVKLWPTREYGSTRVFVPIYQMADGFAQPFEFQGLELAANDLPCLAGLKRVPDSAHAPVWLDLVLNKNWKTQHLYQTATTAVPPVTPEPTVYLASPDMKLPSRAVDALSGVPDLIATSKVARVDSVGMVVDGIAESSTSYLVMSRLTPMTTGTTVIAVGELFSGGFTLGLQKDGLWMQTLNVSKAGRFVAAVRTTTNGTYQVVIANVNENPAMPTKLIVSGLKWFPGVPPPATSVP